MGLSPSPHPLHLMRASEVILVLRFVQPTLLTLPFAGLAAGGLGAELLSAAVAGHGSENFLTAKAFHRSREKIQHPLPARPVQLFRSLSQPRKPTKKKEEMAMNLPRKPRRRPDKNTAFSNRQLHPVFRSPSAFDLTCPLIAGAAGPRTAILDVALADPADARESLTQLGVLGFPWSLGGLLWNWHE